MVNMSALDLAVFIVLLFLNLQLLLVAFTADEMKSLQVSRSV